MDFCTHSEGINIWDLVRWAWKDRDARKRLERAAKRLRITFGVGRDAEGRCVRVVNRHQAAALLALVPTEAFAGPCNRVLALTIAIRGVFQDHRNTYLDDFDKTLSEAARVSVSWIMALGSCRLGLTHTCHRTPPPLSNSMSRLS